MCVAAVAAALQRAFGQHLLDLCGRQAYALARILCLLGIPRDLVAIRQMEQACRLDPHKVPIVHSRRTVSGTGTAHVAAAKWHVVDAQVVVPSQIVPPQFAYVSGSYDRPQLRLVT
jgi:hypothetical protein